MNSRGFNQENIQNLNRTLLLNLLRREGECSRVHLSELSQLKQATVTNIINDFIDWGLVKETGFLPGSKGRRSIGISINRSNDAVLAIRIARKDYSLGVFDLCGGCIRQVRVKLSGEEKPKETLQIIIDGAKKMMASEERRILAAGVAIPGPFNRKKGRIVMMSGKHGWNEIEIQPALEEAFQIPVFLEQDANAGALAQYWYGRDLPDTSLLVYIAAGQGVGAGVIAEGTLLQGDVGIAGEIGHTSICYNGPRCICGNYGCLENYCSSIAFTGKVNAHYHTDMTREEIVEKMRNGDQTILDLYLEACDMLAVGIVNVINNFNPSVIVLGDEMSHMMPELMLDHIRQKVKEMVIPEFYESTHIMMSIVPQDSMLTGAATVAISDIFVRPLAYFKQ